MNVQVDKPMYSNLARFKDDQYLVYIFLRV